MKGCQMLLSDSWVGCQEPYQRRSYVEECWSIVKKSFEEHIGFKHWHCYHLATIPQYVGHRDVHGKYVEHWQNCLKGGF